MKFEVGKCYNWKELNDFYEEKAFTDTGEDIAMNEYGEDIVAKKAIHIVNRFTDYWFIMDGANGNGVPSYKCVFIQ